MLGLEELPTVTSKLSGSKSDVVTWSPRLVATLKRHGSSQTSRGIPEFYTDLGAMLTKVSPDLVLLCTPPAAHFAQVIACLQANAWVLCEKPICGSLAELSDLAAAEQGSGARCASVFQWRFGAPVLHLKQLMEPGHSRPCSSRNVRHHLVPSANVLRILLEG